MDSKGIIYAKMVVISALLHLLVFPIVIAIQIQTNQDYYDSANNIRTEETNSISPDKELPSRIRNSGSGKIKFENSGVDDPIHQSQPLPPNQSGFVTFDDNTPQVEGLAVTSGPDKVLFPESGEANLQILVPSTQDLDTDNQLDQNKKRKRRRRRKNYRRQFQNYLNMINEVGTTPQPIPPEGALAALSDAIVSLVRNDNKSCLQRLFCEKSFKLFYNKNGDDNFNATIEAMQLILTYIPLLTHRFGFSLEPLRNATSIFGKAIMLGHETKHIETCQTSYPECANNSIDLADYMINNQGGILHFFGGNKITKYNGNNLQQQLGIGDGNVNLDYYKQPANDYLQSQAMSGLGANGPLVQQLLGAAQANQNPASYTGQNPYSQYGTKIWSDPYQSNTYPANAYQANPYQANTYQANPYQANPYQTNPYQANLYQVNSYQSPSNLNKYTQFAQPSRRLNTLKLPFKLKKVKTSSKTKTQ